MISYLKPYPSTKCVCSILTLIVFLIYSCDFKKNQRSEIDCSLKLTPIENCKCKSYYQKLDNGSYNVTYIIDTIKNSIIGIDSIVTREKQYLQEKYLHDLAKGDSSVSIERRKDKYSPLLSSSSEYYSKLRDSFMLKRTLETQYDSIGNLAVQITKYYNEQGVVDSSYQKETTNYSLNKTIRFITPATILLTNYDSISYASDRKSTFSVSRIWTFFDANESFRSIFWSEDNPPPKNSIQRYSEKIVGRNNSIINIDFEYNYDTNYNQWHKDTISKIYQSVLDRVQYELFPKNNYRIDYDCLLDKDGQICNEFYYQYPEQKKPTHNQALLCEEKQAAVYISIYIKKLHHE